MDRAWQTHEIETMLSILQDHAPWRGPNFLSEPSFVAAWLNKFEELEANSQLSAENLLAWWQSTEEYQNEWPKWVEKGKEPELPKVESGISGRLRISGSGFADDNGPVLPIGIHLGDLFSKFVRDEGFVKETLSKVAEAKYALVQFWLNLGTLGSYWNGREIGPEITPDYWGQLVRLSDLLDSYGLKGIYNLGDYKLRSLTHAEFFANLHRTFEGRDNIALLIGGNEAWQTGARSKEEIWSALEYFKLSVPKSTTAPPTEDRSEIEKWCKGDYYLIHGYRGGEDHDRIRHIFSVPWEGHPPTKFGYQDEPTGPGNEVSVKPRHNYEGRDVDANHLVTLAAQSLMCNQGFNFFCSDGVKLNGDISRWPGFWEVPRVVNIVPKDIMSWPGPIHFGDSQRGKRVFAPVSGNHFRFDHRISPGGQLFGIFYGDEGRAIARCERPCEFDILNFDGTVANHAKFNKDDDFGIDFRRSGHTAVIVRGRLI